MMRINDNESIALRLREYILQRINYFSHLRINKEDFNTYGLELFLREEIDQWVLTIMKYNFGRHDNKIITFETPKTWKDHFKMKHRNKWWLKRYVRKHPIHLAKHNYDISRWTFFPKWEFPIDFKDKLKVISYEFYKKRDYNYE